MLPQAPQPLCPPSSALQRFAVSNRELFTAPHPPLHFLFWGKIIHSEKQRGMRGGVGGGAEEENLQGDSLLSTEPKVGHNPRTHEIMT